METLPGRRKLRILEPWGESYWHSQLISYWSGLPIPSLCLYLSLCVSCKGFANDYYSFGCFNFSLFSWFIIFHLLNFWRLICSSFCLFLGFMLRSWIFIVFFFFAVAVSSVYAFRAQLCLYSLSIDLTASQGNGTPLQYSCLENPMGRGAW